MENVAEIPADSPPKKQRHQFAKGNKLGGRPPAAGMAFKDRLGMWIEKYTIGQIEAIIKNKRSWKKLASIDAMVAMRISEACERNGGASMMIILDRLLGKPPQAITGEDGAPLIPVTDINEIARRTAFVLSIAATQQIAAPIIDNDKVVSEANSIDSSDENKVKI